MNLSTLRRLPIAAALFILFCSTSAFAAATVSITPSGDSSYVVQGSGMDGVVGIQLDIAYDAASLATPTVIQGGLVSGAMLAANTNQTGIIKIAIISTRAFSARGQIASISFASKTGSGGITSAKSSVVNSAGTTVPAPVSITNASGSGVPDPSSIAGLPFAQTNQTGQPEQTVTGTTPTYPGTITLPSEQQSDSQPAAASTAPDDTGEPAAARIADQPQPSGKPAVDSKPEETPQYVVYKGISDWFKQYRGNKSLSAMAALFDKKVAQNIHQEPAILLNDGQSSATLTVDIPARVVTSPNFAVNGGTLVSFKQDKQNKSRWAVEVKPETGAIRTIVTIIAGTEEFEYPLTIVPPVKTALTLDENGWNRFLREVGTPAAPLHDLNNDGVRDYMDEYIFIAHQRIGKSNPANSVIPSTKSAQ